MAVIRGKSLIEGSAAGPILRLAGVIGFWGGVDAETGRIIDPRHADCGKAIGGTVLALPATIGSSSSSSVMLELIRRGRAPAALLLAEVDAILTLGVVVAGEMGYGVIPVLAVAREDMEALPQGAAARVEGGSITFG